MSGTCATHEKWTYSKEVKLLMIIEFKYHGLIKKKWKVSLNFNLEVSECERDLGVCLSSDLKWSKHISNLSRNSLAVKLLQESLGK